MGEVVDETLGTGMPIPLRFWDSFQWSHGCNQPLSQWDRDELVRSPDALSRADLVEWDVSVLADDINRGEPYLYPSHWIAQRCVSLKFLENVVDLDNKVRTGE